MYFVISEKKIISNNLRRLFIGLKLKWLLKQEASKSCSFPFVFSVYFTSFSFVVLKFREAISVVET